MIDKDEYKYKDINHPPVPMLKVGDRCYTHWTHGGADYSHVSTCEIRKVEVKWYEPSEYDRKHLGNYGHWYINYYIRSNVDSYGLKSTKMFPYHTGEEGGKQELYLTPQEVMDENIRNFRSMVENNIKSMQKKMLSLGYTKEQTNKLLEHKPEDK